MSNDGRCFECYGYDILLDENLKPWLIEVNASPSITADTETDYHLKFGMLEDLFGVLRVEKTSVPPSPRSWPVTALLDAHVPYSTMRCQPPVEGLWKIFRPRPHHSAPHGIPTLPMQHPRPGGDFGGWFRSGAQGRPGPSEDGLLDG